MLPSLASMLRAMDLMLLDYVSRISALDGSFSLEKVFGEQVLVL